MSGTAGPSRPPDGPYGPGWNGAEDAHWEDWGASADRRNRPQPKSLRYTAIVLGLLAALILAITFFGWLAGDFQWSQLLMGLSQLGLSASFYFQYRSAQRTKMTQ